MDTNAKLAYATLFAPLAATALITLFTLRSKAASMALALGGIGAGLVCSVLMATHVFAGHGGPPIVSEFEWLKTGGITMSFGVQVDALSVLMSLVVTGVGSCIFLFSTGYMKGEEGWSRYFACLSLFAFSMLGIVFSTNLLETFIFWELVGVSSYALIGYYFGKPSAVDAGKKAFLTNRIGDFGMTCGILLLYFTLARMPGVEATFSFTALKDLYDEGGLIGKGYDAELALAAFLVFTGALAKSAQVPLHVWLPDAMEGPTPVSALMHAATMVAAGVYLVARTFFLFVPYHWPLETVAWIGGVTAFLAATMAFVQTDAKKVLAYSTLSQLGYMTMALGLKAPGAAMFHLTTHACFKALLFLCAGSVIYGCHHEQDMRWMGGLRKRMPVTAYTYLIGGLALAGIAPLSGFFSKDAILGTASEHNVALYAVGLCVAFMTACYMGRAWFMTFCGEYRGPRPAELREAPVTWTPSPHASADDGHGHGAHAAAHASDAHAAHGHGDAHAHDAGHGHAASDHGHDAGHGDHGDHHGHHEPSESPWVMTVPLVVLAVLSIGAGLLNLPQGFFGREHGGVLEHALMGTDQAPVWFKDAPPEIFNGLVAVFGTLAAVLGGLVAWMYYGKKSWSADAFVARFGGLHRLVVNKYYFDDVYLWIVRNVQQRIAEICAWFEKSVLVRGVVGGISELTKWFGQNIRLLLDGHLHTYVTIALGGVFFILALVLATQGR